MNYLYVHCVYNAPDLLFCTMVNSSAISLKMRSRTFERVKNPQDKLMMFFSEKVYMTVFRIS
jgi:hypothetical protein